MWNSRSWLKVATAGIVLATAAACGSSGGSKPTTSSADVASSDQAGVTAAQSTVDQYSKLPTSIGISTPLTGRPPAGKTLVNLACNAGSCPYLDQRLKVATRDAGWNYVSIPFDISNPANLVSALKEALQHHPTAVTFNGLPQAVWSSVIPAYKAAGVALIPAAVGPVTTDSTVIYNIDDPAAEEAAGGLVGDWFVATTKGKGHALVVDFPDIPITTATVSGITNEIGAHCAACTVTTIKATTAQVQSGKVSAAIVSAVQRDPSIKYVLSGELNFSSDLTSQLKAAGLTGVKVAGVHPDNLVMSGLASGAYSAAVPTPLSLMAFETVDIAIRHATGMPLPTKYTLPMQLVTPATVGKLTETSAYLEQPADYEQQYKALWRLN
jgi:ribose transport system substrate-binding protein